MLSKWEQSDDLKKYTAMTTYTVYEVNLSDQGAGWVLRKRDRLWDGRTWTVMGAVRSPEVAFRIAEHDAEESK